MRTRNQVLAAVAVPFLALTAVGADGALAHRGGGKASPEERAQRFEKKKQRVEEMVRDKLAPKLGTDEATTNRLVGIFQAQMEARKAAHQKMRAERKKLAQLVEEGAGAAALDTQLARMAELREGMPKRGALLDETARILTPQQQAVLVLEGPKRMRKRMKKRHRMRTRMRAEGIEDGNY